MPSIEDKYAIRGRYWTNVRFATVMTNPDNKAAGSTWGFLPYVSQKALEQKGHWLG